MRKAFFVSAILLMTVSGLFAQTPVDSVKITIGKLFSAMKNSDSQAILNCFADSAIMQTITRDKNGNNLIKTEKLAEFAKVIAYMPRDAADERISFDMVKTDGALATAWTPYKFYLNGQFSHCGVNSFQLVRLNGQWKIQYLIVLLPVP
jgi:hypothetical protein